MKAIATANYTIYFSDISAWQQYLEAKPYSNYFVIIDEHTWVDCLPFLKNISEVDFKIIVTPSGEWNKSLDTCKLIWDQMISQGADRHSLCINLGGGVIGDMGGFCAASFMRGMDFVQVPTSLLAMVDASIGGKLGIDYQGHKNYIGLFKDPLGVFIFPKFLDTLPHKQLRSGYAEVVKHALIADANLWAQLKKVDAVTVEGLKPFIHQAVSIKHSIVSQDPFESGLRKNLNFGHTIGHALESHFLDAEDHLLHGEAVGLGMICEAFLSYKIGLLSAESYQEISSYINKVFTDLMPRTFDKATILQRCKADKKNRNQEILFSLIDGVGNAVYNQRVDKTIISESLDQIKS